MKNKRFIGGVVIAATSVALLASCAKNEVVANTATSSSAPALSGTINAGGASSQEAAQGAWTKDFQTANTAVTINYEPSGSGAGRSAFIAGGLDFAGSDSTLSDAELGGAFGACATGTKAIDLPVYISPIAVLFNVTGVTKLNLDASTLAKIFKGVITKWNDPAITALNPGTNLPDANITAIHRSDDSGTTKNFTDYLGQNAPDVWDQKAADAFPYKTGEGAKGTSGVVDAVTKGSNTIAYADASRAGTLGVVKIKVGTEYVGYSAAAAAAVVADSPLVSGRDAVDISLKLNRTTTDPSHYPLVLVSYVIVCKKYADPKKGELVKAYVGSMVSAAGQRSAATAAGSAPLSATLSGKVTAALATIK